MFYVYSKKPESFCDEVSNTRSKKKVYSVQYKHGYPFFTFYIIQTNTSLNHDNETQDFQSSMYKITKQTWEEFKEYIISNEQFTTKLVQGTMMGYTKPHNCIVEEVLINDDIHLEIRLSYGTNNHIKSNSKYYMITEENFNRLL